MSSRALIAVALVAACGSDDAPPPASTEVGDCTGIVEVVADQGGQHVVQGTPVEWTTNPPSTGPHYQNWARWNREYTELDRRYWLHNVEHGGIVLLYNCPEGCPEIVEALRMHMRERAVDPACSAPIYNRMMIVADPLLPPDVRVAASAWNTTYTDSCIDPYLERFIAQRYNQAPEDFCFEGIELGGTFVAR